MLVWLAEYLTQFESGFNVFSYLTLRAILSVLSALMLSVNAYRRRLGKSHLPVQVGWVGQTNFSESLDKSF